MSPGPGDSGTPLGLNQIWGLWSLPGPHLELVNLVPFWASPRPGDFVPDLDLIAWTLSCPHLELVTLILSVPHPDLVTLVLTWASLVPGDSVPHLSLTWT